MVHTDNTWMKQTLGRGFSGYHLIFGFSYLVFLAIALAGQVLGWHWRTWLPGAEGVKSLFGGVKAAVYTFMSHVL
jgi:light-harvesting complex 1 beta chain